MIRHLLCIAAASALLAPTVPRAAPAAPLSMGVEVGGGIKTVSATIAAFESNYPKPVATLWRSPINDMLQTTHLSVVNQDFKYDALFGYGFLVASNFYSAVLMILIGIVLHNGAPYLGGHGNTALYTTNFVVAYVSSFFYLALFGMVLAFKGRLVGVPPSALKTLHSNNMA